MHSTQYVPTKMRDAWHIGLKRYKLSLPNHGGHMRSWSAVLRLCRRLQRRCAVRCILHDGLGLGIILLPNLRHVLLHSQARWERGAVCMLLSSPACLRYMCHEHSSPPSDRHGLHWSGSGPLVIETVKMHAHTSSSLSSVVKSLWYRGCTRIPR
jgi:hypothetical protein